MRRRRRRAEVPLGVVAERARKARLQWEVERKADESAITELPVSVRLPAGDGFAPALTRSDCFSDLLELGLSAEQARRVLDYLHRQSAAPLRDA